MSSLYSKYTRQRPTSSLDRGELSVRAWLRLAQFLAVVILLAGFGFSATADVRIYSDSALDADKARYRQRLEYLLEKGLKDFMTPAEKSALKDVVLWFPQRGLGPLSFEALVLDGEPTVKLPLMSVKFIEDLSVAYAWRYQNRYSLEPMDEFLTILKHRTAKEFPGGTIPDPMQALGVPAKIWERDTSVDKLSLSFRNTAWAFILAHELGHLYYGHTTTTATAQKIQQQEQAADEFALNLLSRSKTIPMGMILWFQASAGYLKNRSDFPSDSAFKNWLSTRAEHPVNGRRLQNIASGLERQAKAERDAARAEQLRFIAIRIGEIGKIIEDTEMQQYLKGCAMSRNIKDLQRLQDFPCR